MHLDHTLSGDLLEITVNAERIDAASSIHLKDQFRAATEGHSGRVAMVMSQVGFMDSSGLGAMVAMLKLLGGRKLELIALTPVVGKVFTMTRMDKVFVLHDTVEAARSFDPGKADAA
jgi:anti-sigma B factor antagonist